MIATTPLTVEEVKKAFGGCEKCYGKGYSTQMDPLGSGEVKVNTCTCDRGKQIDQLLETMRKSIISTLFSELEKNLPEYIEETYPKGKTKERGAATVHISLFLLEAKKALSL